MVAALHTQGGDATIFTGRTRGSPRDAVFVNAMTLNSVGLNDIHTGSVSHPGGCVIPVVLAAGEAGDLSGRDVLVAMIAGYPQKPIRLIVPLAPGGGNDTLARYVGKYLNESLGQSVIIENRTGGGALASSEYCTPQ